MNVKANEDLIFDILIDKERIPSKNNKNDIDTINLYKEIERYGSIIVNIVDHTIDKPAVELFFNSLLKYISLSKNKIGLALIIGDTANPDAFDLANKLGITFYYIHLLLHSKTGDNYVRKAKMSTMCESSTNNIRSLA